MVSSFIDNDSGDEDLDFSPPQPKSDRGREIKIFEIRKVSMIPLFLGEAPAAANEYIEGIASILSHGSFYYSWDIDLSK